MAIYNLYDGGTVFAENCTACGKDQVDDKELPFVVQPDLRVHGGYGFRHKTNWQDLMLKLAQRYGKDEGDLKVGDRLRIFIQPNHATLKSLSVDFKHAASGFVFTFESVRGLDIAPNLDSVVTSKTVYNNETGEVKTFVKSGATLVADQESGAVVDGTHYTCRYVEFGNTHHGKTDAVELVIKALPVNGLSGRDFDAWFVRRFEQDGLFI